MKKVLIVSPHFPPINAPDMQRVRLSLPYLRALGWEPTVLAIAPDYVEGGVREQMLEQTYPSDVRIVRVKGLSPAATRWAGFGNIWFRCGRAIARAGAQLLRQERFDLVFFSTTQFGAFALGPQWLQQFGVPYVVDYQDPWVNDYYERTKTKPPGGWFKFRVSQWSARLREPRVLREAAGVVAVSPAYATLLARLYPWFNATRVRVLPFGAAEPDFAALTDYRPAQPLIDFKDGNFHHVYTGRAGADMADSLAVVFRAFRHFRERSPDAAKRMRFHFIGTGYAPAPLGADSVMPIARAEGVADVVTEHRYRVPYFDALYYLRNADALVAVGSNDETYAASKIFPYVLARRPLLLVFHSASSVLKFADEVAAGMRFALPNSGAVPAVATEVCQRWFEGGGYRESPTLNVVAANAYTSEALTAQLVDVFNEAASAARTSR